MEMEAIIAQINKKSYRQQKTLKDLSEKPLDL
jgi:hypothetical protein